MIETDTSAQTASAALPPPLLAAMRVTAYGAIGLVIALNLFGALVPQYIQSGARYVFEIQDQWWLLAGAVFLVLVATNAPTQLARITQRSLARLGRHALATLCCTVVAIAVIGTFVVQWDHGLVRDELMAEFDRRIFARGMAFAPLAPEWRDYAAAMLPRFALPITGHVGWVSSYLPGNAAFRGLVGRLAFPELANPLLLGFSLWACFTLARQLWPNRRDAAWISVLLLATSGQALFAAMTSFAMTGHMALTLAWLLLFRRSDRPGAIGAVAIGFLATGWHQLVFHLVFAAPFVANLWWRRQWTAAAWYTLAYAAISAFWISYWAWTMPSAGVVLTGGAQSGAGYLFDRIFGLLSDVSVFSLVLMAYNFARLVAWQNVLLVPLVIIALSAVVRAAFKNATSTPDRPLPLLLAQAAVGAALTIALVTVLLPFQGHGWGYRYLHGYLGVFCLIATHAWVMLVPAWSGNAGDLSHKSVSAVWGVFGAAMVASLLVILPGQALQVRAYVGQLVRPANAIAHANADIVVIDDRTIFYGEELVDNDPFLRNRPLTMLLAELEPGLARRLCALGTRVALFDRSTARALGAKILSDDPLEDWPDGRKAIVQHLPCAVSFEVR